MDLNIVTATIRYEGNYNLNFNCPYIVKNTFKIYKRLKIPINDNIYNVKIFTQGLQVCGVKNLNTIPLIINKINEICNNNEVYNEKYMKIMLITCKFPFDVHQLPLYIVEKYSVLKSAPSLCVMYKGKLIASIIHNIIISKDIENIKKIHQYFYVKEKLPIFINKIGWFKYLPKELIDFILDLSKNSIF